MDTAPADSLRLTEGVADDYDHDDSVMQVLERWHNETHRFAFAICREQPCYAAQKAAGLT